MMIIHSRLESTIDYPGKVGVIIFAQGCNLRCGFCHNPELIECSGQGLDTAQLLKELETRARAGWYEAVCISGGEPTLQHNLIAFTAKLKGMGLLVKLDTNGTRPGVLKQLLDLGTVDSVAMDIKAPRERYQAIAHAKINLPDLDESIGLVKRFPHAEFRTTCIPALTEDDFNAIGSWLSSDGLVKLFTLQQFNPKKTLDPSYGKLKPKEQAELRRIAKLMKRYAEAVRIV